VSAKNLLQASVPVVELVLGVEVDRLPTIQKEHHKACDDEKQFFHASFEFLLLETGSAATFLPNRWHKLGRWRLPKLARTV
jgi:hypothetical protein